MIPKKPAFKDYKINEQSPAVEVTMEELNVSRKEAIKIMRELSYRVSFPKKKKKHAA